MSVFDLAFVGAVLPRNELEKTCNFYWIVKQTQPKCAKNRLSTIENLHSLYLNQHKTIISSYKALSALIWGLMDSKKNIPRFLTNLSEVVDFEVKANHSKFCVLCLRGDEAIYPEFIKKKTQFSLFLHDESSLGRQSHI